MMYKSLFIFLIICSAVRIQGQMHFAARCEGDWEGTMYMYRQGALIDSVVVQFKVAPAQESGTWTWKTTYRSSTRPLVKNYLLRVIDVEKGIYLIDEGDGVLLHAYQNGNKLYSVFETEGILLTSSYELLGKTLLFEVTSGRELTDATGQVKSYSINHVQRVLLQPVSVKKP